VSRTDREIVEEIYERWNRNDGDLALDLFAEDAEFHQTPTILDSAREFRGPAGVLESARELAAWRRIDWNVESWLQEGRWLITRVRVVAVGRASGIVQEVTVAQAWRVDGGQVTRFFVYPDVSAAVRAIQAAGGGEPDAWTSAE
jgi:ketosteroid isomerase-like protein